MIELKDNTGNRWFTSLTVGLDGLSRRTMLDEVLVNSLAFGPVYQTTDMGSNLPGTDPGEIIFDTKKFPKKSNVVVLHNPKDKSIQFFVKDCEETQTFLALLRDLEAQLPVRPFEPGKPLMSEQKGFSTQKEKSEYEKDVEQRLERDLQEKERQLSDVEKHVEEMFIHERIFFEINTPENRRDFLNAVLECSYYGRLSQEAEATPADVEEWLNEYEFAPEERFSDWMLDKLWQEEPTYCDEPIYEFVEGIREKIMSSDNQELKKVLESMDNFDLRDSIMEYGVAYVDLKINEPCDLKVNFVFATAEEVRQRGKCIASLWQAVNENSAAEKFLNDPEWAVAMCDNAFTKFLAAQGNDLGEALKTGPSLENGNADLNASTDKLDKQEAFLFDARCEFELSGGEYSALLTVLARSTPDQLYDLLSSESIYISEQAAVGLYDPWEGGGGGSIEMNAGPGGVSLPRSLIYQIEIEGGNRKMTVDSVYGMTPDNWVENAVSCASEVNIPEPDFDNLRNVVKERMEMRESMRENIASPTL